MKRKGDWMTTYTGVQFWPLDPRPDEIRLADIAHALSNQCRFAGHSKCHYSVAEHSCLVATLVEEDLGCSDVTSLGALLHDASEAYLTDIPRPLKRQPMFAAYREAEHTLQRMIWAHFDVPDYAIDVEAIEIADALALIIEMRELMPSMVTTEWTDAQVKRVPAKYSAILKRPFEHVPSTPADSEAAFLSMGSRLGMKARHELGL